MIRIYLEGCGLTGATAALQWDVASALDGRNSAGRDDILSGHDAGLRLCLQQPLVLRPPAGRDATLRLQSSHGDLSALRFDGGAPEQLLVCVDLFRVQLLHKVHGGVCPLFQQLVLNYRASKALLDLQLVD